MNSDQTTEVTIHFGALAETFPTSDKDNNPLFKDIFKSALSHMKDKLNDIAKNSICISDMGDEVDPVFEIKTLKKVI